LATCDTDTKESVLKLCYKYKAEEDLKKKKNGGKDIAQLMKPVEPIRSNVDEEKKSKTPAVMSIGLGQKIRSDMQSIRSQLGSLCQNAQNIRSKEDAPKKDDRACWNCGTHGHISRDCWKPKKTIVKNSAKQNKFSWNKNASNKKNYQKNSRWGRK